MKLCQLSHLYNISRTCFQPAKRIGFSVVTVSVYLGLGCVMESLIAQIDQMKNMSAAVCVTYTCIAL